MIRVAPILQTREKFLGLWLGLCPGKVLWLGLGLGLELEDHSYMYRCWGGGLTPQANQAGAREGGGS